MQSAPNLPLLSGLHGTWLFETIRVSSMGQIELFELLKKLMIIGYLKRYTCVPSQPALVVEYTDCTSSEE